MVNADRLLDLAGFVLVAVLVVGVGTAIMAATNASSGESEAVVPEANWTVEQVNDTHVAVVHDGGQPVDPAALVVSVDGLQRQVTWPDPVTPGDAVVLFARSGQAVRIHWDPQGTERTLIRTWRIE